MTNPFGILGGWDMVLEIGAAGLNAHLFQVYVSHNPQAVTNSVGPLEPGGSNTVLGPTLLAFDVAQGTCTARSLVLKGWCGGSLDGQLCSIIQKLPISDIQGTIDEKGAVSLTIHPRSHISFMLAGPDGSARPSCKTRLQVGEWRTILPQFTIPLGTLSEKAVAVRGSAPGWMPSRFRFIPRPAQAGAADAIQIAIQTLGWGGDPARPVALPRGENRAGTLAVSLPTFTTQALVDGAPLGGAYALLPDGDGIWWSRARGGALRIDSGSMTLSGGLALRDLSLRVDSDAIKLTWSSRQDVTFTMGSDTYSHLPERNVLTIKVDAAYKPKLEVTDSVIQFGGNPTVTVDAERPFKQMKSAPTVTLDVLKRNLDGAIPPVSLAAANYLLTPGASLMVLRNPTLQADDGVMLVEGQAHDKGGTISPGWSLVKPAGTLQLVARDGQGKEIKDAQWKVVTPQGGSIKDGAYTAPGAGPLLVTVRATGHHLDAQALIAVSP